MPGTLARRALVLFVLVAGVLLHVAVLHTGTAAAAPAETGVIATAPVGPADCPEPHAPTHTPSAADAPLTATSVPGLLPAVVPLPDAEPQDPPTCSRPSGFAPPASAGAALCTELCVSRR